MKKCHGRNRCAIDVEEYVFGNPCPPAMPKYLRVIYTCGKDPQHVIFTCVIVYSCHTSLIYDEEAGMKYFLNKNLLYI